MGLGGHSRTILESLGGKATLLGIDWDAEALALARENLASFGDAVHLVCTNFTDLGNILRERGIDAVDGILMDLGVSSLQLEKGERGFSFQREGPLDMRMSQTLTETAADLVARLGERELADLFYAYGEERGARRLARALVQRRERGGTLEGTRELAEFTAALFSRRGKIHPATRVFQALRIRVNRELDNLSRFTEEFDRWLKSGGRLAVISYHSLEDRIVKQAFKRKTTIKIVTKKPIVPGAEERRMNPRSRSAKLRIAEKL
jgi:16S rRNA (cytosine1402-N4)-methyltransferase